jgi:hypothetical protein
MFSFTRYQTVFGICQVILPPGLLGFIARFFQYQCERLPLRGMLGGYLLQCLQGGVDTSGLEGFQHGRFDSTIYP